MDDLTDNEMDSLANAMGDVDKAESELTNERPATATASAESSHHDVAEAQPEFSTPTAPPASGISHAQFMQLEDIASAADIPPAELERMQDIRVKVEVVLGSCKMPLESILKLRPGSVVELQKLAGEPVDILANNQIIARAEVVVIEDRFGVKVLEIVGTQQKLSAVK